VYSSLWEAPESIPHIRLVREADVLLVAPATANVIAKLALGLADDLLTTCALAARIPIVVAPAMNAAMYEHAATSEHLATLVARGVTIIEPQDGFLAERETGIGRLALEEQIIAGLDRSAARSNELRGSRVVITAGPTREPIDPVRFCSNASSGITGIELTREALRRGAQVDLVLGPTSYRPPAGARVMCVTTALEMREAALQAASGADILIATAAVSDWRPAHRFEHKVKKDDAPASIDFVRNPDILAELGARNDGTFLVGFAAETDAAERNAREKLQSKRLDAIVVNDVLGGAGFGPGDNELVLLWGERGRRELGRASKAELAARLWDALRDLRENHTA
jgi:phosphopantothenoylcysteine decarboxylase/phosphopantothenate--cysteine ligase